MSDAGNRGSGETQRSIPRQVSSLPRDLLQRFMSSKNHCYPQYQNRYDTNNGVDEEEEGEGEEEEEEDIELSLGLSLNGRFGVDPLAKSRLTRSSSIPEFIIHNSVKSRTSDSDSAHVGASAGLIRTCSLPTETEEEWRKRKELQSLRRLEAKRKRSEKQRSQRALREKQKSVAEEKILEDRREEGSIGSSGSGSSGLSELDSLHTPVQATNKLPNTRSPSTATPPLPERPDNSGENRGALEDMPFVSTKGDGPNGKRIDGFLYRYRKGEEVRIVCVCHGSFLSPAEFVKHAGGGDVAHPLKHIVVNPSPFM